jgi:tetratricopeptide (TPR) repeat protein
MDGTDFDRIRMVGREREFGFLKDRMQAVEEGRGSTVLVSGEAGIGKTRLVEEFCLAAGEKDVRVLKGAALADQSHPFLAFSRALGETERPLFEERVYRQFSKIFAVAASGTLVAETSSGKDELGADVLAGMLSAVQDFVRDSFDGGGDGQAGLGRLEYGELKVLVEHCRDLTLAAICKGEESADMRGSLKRTLADIEEGRSGVNEGVASLSETKFLVRKALEGVQLDKERVRIADRILRTLTEMAGRGPLLLVLEDLHWADESSLFVLGYLARNVRDLRVLVLGTSRPEESSVLRTAVELMDSEGSVQHLTLERLGGDKVSQLIGSLCPLNDFPTSLSENISERCGGNPFFVTETIRHMLDAGNIALRENRFVLIGEDYVIPATVEEVAGDRLETLEPDALTLAEYASCIGREFDRDAALSLHSMKDPSSAVGKLESQGIVRFTNGTGEFHHAIYQDILYQGLGDRWKAVYHKSLGEHYETAADSEAVIFELARHFAKTNEDRKAFDYCVRAGEKAETTFAVEQAAVFYESALAALGNIRTRSRDMEVMVLERLGDVRVLVGEYDKAIENFGKAKETAKDNETKASMLRKIGGVHGRMGEFDMSLEVFAEAKELAEEGTVEHGRILFSEGFPHWRKGDFDKGLALYDTALKTFKESGAEEKDIGNVLRSVGNILLSKGEFDPALEYYEKSLAVMEKIGERQGIAAALNNIGNVYDYKGDLENALGYYERVLEMEEKMGYKSHIAMALNNIGNMHNAKGEPDRALECFERSLEIREKIGDKSGIAMALTCIGLVYLSRGELDKVLEFYERGLAINEKIGDKHGIALSLNNIGQVYKYKGELDSALKYHGRGLDISSEIGDKWLAVHNHCGLAEAYLELKDTEKVHDNVQKAIEIAIEIGSKAEEAWSYRILGMVYGEAKEWDKAVEEFEKAWKILEEFGEKMELAILSYEYGQMRRAKGEPEKAKELLERALAMSREMGMRLWAERARKVLEEL